MLRSKSQRGVTPLFTVAVVCVALTAPPLLAQVPSFAERETMYLRYLELATLIEDGSVEPQWMADGNSFWYAEGAPENTVIYKVDPEANTKTELFDTERLREGLTKALGHEPPYRGLPFDRFTFEGREERTVRFAVERKEFVLDLGSYTITRVEAPVRGERERSRSTPQRGEILSPDGKWFAGADGYNLTLRSTTDGRRVPLTTDGIEDYEWVLGRWSPNGVQLAAWKVDRRHTPKYPSVHWLKAVPEVEWIEVVGVRSTCEMSGGGQSVACPATMLPVSRGELYMVDIRSKRQIRVNTGDEVEQRLGGLQWRPDGSELLFAKGYPLRKKLDLMAADAATGATRIALTETAETFLTFPGSPSAFPFLDSGKRFIWRSERDGWFHLYLYDTDGTLIRRLTQGPFEVDWPIVDEATGWIYFEAPTDPEQPYYKHLHRVTLEGEGYTRLTERPGRLEGISPWMKYFVWTVETPTQPPVVELRRADGTLLQTLSRANIDRLVEELHWKPPEEFVVKAADGETDLHGLLYKPWDFDPSRRYPVVQVIYGNPSFPFHTWSSGFVGNRRCREGRALAQMGFIVFLVEERGTRGRGKAFYDVMYGNLGRYQILDDDATLEQLAEERPYMDLSRVGVLGGSYGGYAATRAMLLAPDVYQVGVATSASFKKWTQTFMGSPPHENPEAYEYASNLTHVGNLKGKLLLGYGTSDVNMFHQGMKLVEALTRAGKAYDLLILPEVGHSPQGASRAYRNRRIIRYFVEHLKPELEPEEETAVSGKR